MKFPKICPRWGVTIASAAAFVLAASAAQNAQLIPITTAQSQLTLLVGTNQHLYQLGYGASANAPGLPGKTPALDSEFYPQTGNGFLFEPALQAVHADGNTSTDLRYVRHETTALDSNITLTRIELRDSFYPFRVVLNLKTYRSEDVIEQWAEISHDEDGAVTLEHFASASPELPAGDYWLTQLHGDWAKEGQLAEEKLTFGMKVLDTKLGVRAHQYRTPVFMLSKGGPAKEDAGEVYGGTLGWSGSSSNAAW